MESHETSEEVDCAAAEWAARLDRGPLSSAELTMLDEWAAADVRRFGALARALAILASFDQPEPVAVSDDLKPARAARRVREMARRDFIYGGAVAAAVGGLSLAGALAYDGRGQYRTAKGELRSVPLADGSMIWMNTDSAVKVHYDRGSRNVVLAKGEALFDVAKDRDRPFIVHAGDTRVRAVGTSFSVSHMGDSKVQVLVTEGQVDVAPPGAAARPPVRLIPGYLAVSAAPGRVDITHVGVAQVARALSWRRGLLDFDGVTLAQAAATFAKYSDDAIVVQDPEVARMTVTGLFSSTDPDGFAKAAALSLDLKAQRRPGAIYLSR
jgi:transmembrane sensor